MDKGDIIMKVKSIIQMVALTTLSMNSIQAQIKEDILFKRQWGVSNIGQSLYRSTGELTQNEIKGSAGIDIEYVDVSKIEKLNIPAQREVVVAVLDTGLDIHHPELKDRIYIDRELCPNAEDIGNKPCSGFNILKNNLNLMDEDGHGTHVAGIIAANANSQGVAGVTDSRIKILPVKVLNEEINHFVYNKKLVTDWFADGIAYSLARGADVINMSIGWPAIIHTPKMKNVLKIAAQKNIPVIVAAGNNNKEIPTYPCTEENVICVGAYDNQGAVTEFSNFGGKVDISAPGESIVSLYPMESVESRVLRIKGYEVKNGTSQAAPFVAAIAASIKLAYPDISYDELKARLYSTAKSEVPSNDKDKFTQYGRVSMKDALLNEPKEFIAANFKNLLEVNYSVNTGRFTFPLDIKSYVSDVENVEVKIKFESSDIELNSAALKIDLYKGDSKKILVEGKINDQLIDSNQLVNITIKTQNNTYKNKTKIVFSRDLSFENESTGLIIEKVEDTPYSDLLYFRGTSKTSRIKRLKTNYGSSPEYFTMKSKLQSEDSTVISILKRTKESSWILEDIKIRRFHSVIRIFKNDMDHDGEEDYVVYGVLPGEQQLGYSYILKDETLDFEFSILDYENFPLSADDLSSSSFINTQYKSKTLKVPSFYTRYRLTEEDNVDDLLDRVNEKSTANYLYYLDPSDSGVLSLRVLNSPSVMDELKTQLNVMPWQNLDLEKPFNVTTNSQNSGHISGLISTGDEFNKSYTRYTFTHTDEEMEVEAVDIPFAYASENSSVLVWNMTKLGEVSDMTNFVVQPSREMARSLMVQRDGESIFKEFSTHNYSDPIFGVIGSYDDQDHSHLLEGRYFVHYQNHSGQKSKLRINRESSFPGVQFAETLSPVVVQDQGVSRAGAFINSTLIFGSRLYTMVADEFGILKRPAQLSVEIPDQCVHLSPEAIEGSYQYLLLCRERDNSVVFKRLPLVIGE